MTSLHLIGAQVDASGYTDSQGVRCLGSAGLTYKSVSSIPQPNTPDFLPTTSLELDNIRMRDAWAGSLPVVLLSNITTARLGSMLRAWHWIGDET
jgi:hypothetical protein